MGKVPSLGPRFDTVDFVPVGLLADILLDLSTASRVRKDAADHTSVFHVRNPRFITLLELLPAITEAAGTQVLEIVPPAMWLASLRESSEIDGPDLVVKNPAVKLVDFLSGLWEVDAEATKGTQTQHMTINGTLRTSLAMRKLEHVKLEWMRKWIG